MALVPAAMAAQMLAKAVSGGYIEQPPHFALSKLYNAMAEGIIETLLDISSTIVTVAWVGFQPAGPSVATALGVNGLDPTVYGNLVKTQSGFVGPFAGPFFEGVGEVAAHIRDNADLLEILCPVSAGDSGQLLAILMDPDACYDNIIDALDSSMKATFPTPEPTPGVNPPFPSPPTVIVGVGEVFLQMKILMHAVADQLAAHLLLGTQALWLITGSPAPGPIAFAGSTITTRIL